MVVYHSSQVDTAAVVLQEAWPDTYSEALMVVGKEELHGTVDSESEWVYCVGKLEKKSNVRQPHLAGSTVLDNTSTDPEQPIWLEYLVLRAQPLCPRPIRAIVSVTKIKETVTLSNATRCYAHDRDVRVTL